MTRGRDVAEAIVRVRAALAAAFVSPEFQAAREAVDRLADALAEERRCGGVRDLKGRG